MSAPLKPWERVGVNSQNYAHSNRSNPVNSMASEFPSSLTGLHGAVGGASPAVPQRAVPLVPQRPSLTQSPYGGGLMGDNGGYGYHSPYSNYGGYGSRMYGGLGSYGGYGGGYGSSINRFGMNNQQPNSFVRAAEESSRQAFQSVESIVQAFGSVAMMLESTFQAVYNSFQAVIGVADHFSRMKATFKQVFSALALWRVAKWLYNKLLVVLGLRSAGLNDEVWASAVGSVGTDGDGIPKKSNWPLVLFLGIALGGPWLIWKILSQLVNKKEESTDWASGNSDHFVAVGDFDFQAQSDEEVSFRAGQKINIAPKELQPRVRGRLLGSVDGKKTGLLPANHVKVLGKQKGRCNTAPKTTTTPADSTNKPLMNNAVIPQGPSSAEMQTLFESSSPVNNQNIVSDNITESDFDRSAVFGDNVAESRPADSSLFKTAEDILEESKNQN